jgi:hypothetical protein
MAELTFGCTVARAERYTATPTLSFHLTIAESTGVPVHAIALPDPHRTASSPVQPGRSGTTA